VREGRRFPAVLVGVVLGNPDVLLRDGRGRVVAKGPTAAVLFGKPAADHLDLPGNPLHPGCGFGRDFRRWSAEKPAVTYAHIATERGRLAVQYWLYDTFNKTRGGASASRCCSSRGWRLRSGARPGVPPRLCRSGPVGTAVRSSGSRGRSTRNNFRLLLGIGLIFVPVSLVFSAV
jgi:hypothetical protein